MKKIVLLLIALAISYGMAYFDAGLSTRADVNQPVQSSAVDQAQIGSRFATDSIQTLFQNQQSNVQVNGAGRVIKVLADDLNGSRHQRFILKLPSGVTVLVTHNIDLAPKLEGLRAGETVEFFGEYEWNARGGVIHWTHDDPAGRHADGWLKFNGRLYQ